MAKTQGTLDWSSPQNCLLSRPMSSFRNFLQPHTPFNPRMPLVHSTSFQKFRDIIQSHILSPTPCSVFDGEDLLYLFYGRPAYRVSKTVTSKGQLRHLPVCFVLEPHSISTAKRIYPFDSGAFSEGLFNEFLKGFELDNFHVGDFPEAPQRLVSAFYGNNKNYYFGEVSTNLNVSVLDFEVTSYVDMIKDTTVTFNESTKVPSDDRRQTVEIQSDSQVGLVPEKFTDTSGTSVVRNNVLAVVLPQTALDVREISEAVTVIWKAEPITYKLYNFTKPDEYHSIIREKVADLLERKGVI